MSVLNSLGFFPADLWLACQHKLLHNQQIGNSGKGTYTWLTALLKCAKCGYSLKVLTDGSLRRLLCSGRYHLSRCDASIHIKLDELEVIVSHSIETMLEECSGEEVPITEDNTYKAELEELDRRADRLLDAFAESNDLTASCLQRALTRLEQERQHCWRRKSGARAVPPCRTSWCFPGSATRRRN